MNTENTEISLLTADEIKSIVSGANKFTKEQMVTHGREIRLARKDRREYLAGMTENEVTASVAGLMESGLTLVKRMQPGKRKDGRNFATIVLEEPKVKETKAQRELRETQAKLDAALAALANAGLEPDLAKVA